LQISELPDRSESIYNLQSEIFNLQFLLYGRSAANLENYCAHGFGQWSVNRAAAGALVASAAERLSYVSYIDFALASQTHPISPVGHLAEECRDLNAADRENVVHQSFTVFVEGVAAFHLFAGCPEVADVPFNNQISKGFSQQTDFGQRVREINSTGAVRGISARQH
jgi:hypothetical protein